MQRIEYPQALPGKCYICGSNNRDWFIDTGQSIDFFGAFIVCNLCIEEMSSYAGMLAPRDSEVLKQKVEELESENFQLQLKVTGMEQALDGLRLAGYSIGVSSISNAGNSSSVANEEPQSRESSVAEGAGSSTEQVHDEGMAELPHDATSDKSFSIQL